jgi:hypothetical protein
MVEFKLGSTVVGTATTDANGVATLSNVSLSGYDAGTYNGEVLASFAGDANYSTSTNTGNLTVNKATATLSFVSGALKQIYDGSPRTVRVDTSPTSLNGVSVTYDDSANAPTNAGSYTVKATLSNANYVADPIQDTLVVGKAASSISISNLPTNATFGGTFTPQYTATGDGTKSTSSNTPSICSVNGGVVSFDAVGTCTLQASIAEGNNYLAKDGAPQSFTISKAVTSTSLTTTPGSVQYSDKVKLDASVSSLAAGTQAGSVEFFVKPVGATGFSSIGSVSLASGSASKETQVTSGPGTATYKAVFTSTNSNFGGSESTKDLTVKQEDARTDYTGGLFATTSGTNTGKATVNLAATIRDITAVTGDSAYDPDAGDIKKASIQFVNKDNNQVICSPTIGYVNSSDTKTGTATCAWNVDIGSADSASYTVGMVVNGYYTDTNNVSASTVVTVSKPLPGMITGGGYLVNQNSGGQYAGAAGQKTNFGFNVKWNKSKTGLQGNINTIVRNGSKVYQIKGNSMTSLTTKVGTSTTPGTATFEGKASIQDITNPLAPVSVDGNATLRVTMTDKGEPGSSDTIGITVWNKSGGLWFSSNWDNTKTIEQLLKGGNLQVR